MIQVYSYTSAIAVAASCAIKDEIYVTEVMIHFSAAPTTSEDLTITKNALDGPTYDTLEYSTDPSVTSMTDLSWRPGGRGLPLINGDSLDIAYTNTDTRTITVSVYYEI